MALNYSSNEHRQGKSKTSTECEQMKKNEEKGKKKETFFKIFFEENEEELLSVRLFHEFRTSRVRVFIN